MQFLNKLECTCSVVTNLKRFFVQIASMFGLNLKYQRVLLIFFFLSFASVTMAANSAPLLDL